MANLRLYVICLMLTVGVTGTGCQIFIESVCKWSSHCPDGGGPGDNDPLVMREIQLDAILNDDDRSALAQAGATVLDYQGDLRWRILAPTELDVADLLGPKVLDVQPVRPEQKLSPRLRAGTPPAHAEDGQGNLLLKALTLPDVSPEQLQEDLHGLGGAVSTYIPELRVAFFRIPDSALATVGALTSFRWVEPIAPVPGIEMSRAREYVNNPPDLPGDSDSTPAGSGVAVSIHENNHAAFHPDLSGRIFQGDQPDAFETDIHATMTAGTIAGDGIWTRSNVTPDFSDQVVGMAPGATVYTYAFGQEVNAEANNYEDIVDTLQRPTTLVANNSWGYFCLEEPYGDYTIQAAVYDNQVLGASSDGVEIGEPMTVVFSGGNERDGSSNDLLDCISNSQPPFLNYGTINQPKPAKNPIVVGAVDGANDRMSTFSSWGPTSDGRLKPDLVAPGLYDGSDVLDESGVVTQLSALDDCSGEADGETGGEDQQCFVTTGDPGTVFPYAWYGQTSAAAAIVSGNAAAFIRFYRQFNRGENPEPATVKAYLIHTARDLSDDTSWYNLGPDYASGYGVVDIQAAVEQAARGRVIKGCLDNGEVHNYTGYISYLKATLVWDDHPGTPGAAGPALINDLDLAVTRPDGSRAYPWTLDPAAPSAPAVQTAEDRLNNVEVVEASSLFGDWSVQIRGHNVPEGPQCYTLVYSSLGSILFDGGDSDEDGIPDIVDQCPSTPEDEPVNADGCGIESQVDSDSDGLPDGRDLCPNTAPDVNVDADGCSQDQGGQVPTLAPGTVDTPDLFDRPWASYGCLDGNYRDVKVDFTGDGVDDTLVVITHVAGSGSFDFTMGLGGFMNLTTFCSGNGTKGTTIRFVDMLAPGYVREDDQTWTFKTVPAVRLVGDAGSSGLGTYSSMTGRRGGFSMTNYNIEPHFTNGRTRLFSHVDGITEVAFWTDFIDNTLLDDLILMQQHPNTRFGTDVVASFTEGRVRYPSVRIPGNTFFGTKTTAEPLPPGRVACPATSAETIRHVLTNADAENPSEVCIRAGTCDPSIAQIYSLTTICGLPPVGCTTNWQPLPSTVTADNLVCADVGFADFAILE